jgi:hypothetical protein
VIDCCRGGERGAQGSFTLGPISLGSTSAEGSVEVDDAMEAMFTLIRRSGRIHNWSCAKNTIARKDRAARQSDRTGACSL